ncbi:hypothetical protein D3C72_967620 [compost metagenome]
MKYSKIPTPSKLLVATCACLTFGLLPNAFGQVSCRTILTAPRELQIDLKVDDYDLAVMEFTKLMGTRLPTVKAELIAQLKIADSKVEAALTERGIRFETTPQIIDKELQLNQFVILPEGNHALNKMAASLKKYGINVSYHPFGNRLNGFVAAYDPNTMTLMISRNAIMKRIGEDEAHEIIHALLSAQEDGKFDFMPKAPVLIMMTSKSGINSHGTYAKLMSYQELVTYAYNISNSGRVISKITAKKNVTPEDAQTRQTLLENFFNTRSIFLKVSRNAVVASTEGLALFAQGHKELIEKNGKDYMKIESPDGDFKLEIFIPKDQLLQADAYATKQLNQSLKLANFNLDYFESLERLSESDALLKVRQFKEVQKKFIKSLP